MQFKVGIGIGEGGVCKVIRWELYLYRGEIRTRKSGCIIGPVVKWNFTVEQIVEHKYKQFNNDEYSYSTMIYIL